MNGENRETTPEEILDKSSLENLPGKKNFFFSKKILILGAFIVMIPLVLLLWNLFSNSEKLNLNEPIAYVGDEVITVGQVNSRIDINYGKNSNLYNDTKVKELITEKLVEEALIKQKAKELGIVLTTDDIEIERQLLGTEAANLPVNNKSFLEIKALRKKLEERLTTYRIVDMASVYVSPINYDEQFAQIMPSLETIRENAISGLSMKEAFDKARADGNLDERISLFENEKLVENSISETDLIGNAKKLQVGGVSDIIPSGGGAFFVLKVTDAGDFPYSSIEQWLNEAKTNLVRMNK